MNILCQWYVCDDGPVSLSQYADYLDKEKLFTVKNICFFAGNHVGQYRTLK